ncbi:OmpA family protein [Ensifer sp. ENS10]|uniref:OmpA family protein n=1 Tax=Ensifer sp. ENS10 TaxID=2769286 RepID=UPI001AEE1089|nr:OmpA family protein [Ensifer sp. ENS10]
MSRFVTIVGLAIIVSVGHVNAHASNYQREVRGLKATVLSLKGLGSETKASVSALLARVDSLVSNRNGLTARREGKAIRVSMLGDVLFDFDATDIRPAAEPTLQEIARLIASTPGGRTLVEGHTDSKGTVAYNQVLSERRAKAVAAWLEAHGVGKTRLAVAGVGADHPVAPNEDGDGLDNPEGRALNRRVEFVFQDIK